MFMLRTRANALLISANASISLVCPLKSKGAIISVASDAAATAAVVFALRLPPPNYWVAQEDRYGKLS